MIRIFFSNLITLFLLTCNSAEIVKEDSNAVERKGLKRFIIHADLKGHGRFLLEGDQSHLVPPCCDECICDDDQSTNHDSEVNKLEVKTLGQQQNGSRSGPKKKGEKKKEENQYRNDGSSSSGYGRRGKKGKDKPPKRYIRRLKSKKEEKKGKKGTGGSAAGSARTGTIPDYYGGNATDRAFDDNDDDGKTYFCDCDCSRCDYLVGDFDDGNNEEKNKILGYDSYGGHDSYGRLQDGQTNSLQAEANTLQANTRQGEKPSKKVTKSAKKNKGKENDRRRYRNEYRNDGGNSHSGEQGYAQRRSGYDDNFRNEEYDGQTRDSNHNTYRQERDPRNGYRNDGGDSYNGDKEYMQKRSKLKSSIGDEEYDGRYGDGNYNTYRQDQNYNTYRQDQNSKTYQDQNYNTYQDQNYNTYQDQNYNTYRQDQNYNTNHQDQNYNTYRQDQNYNNGMNDVGHSHGYGNGGVHTNTYEQNVQNPSRYQDNIRNEDYNGGTLDDNYNTYLEDQDQNIDNYHYHVVYHSHEHDGEHFHLPANVGESNNGYEQSDSNTAGTCGGGNTGNGRCKDPRLCCSSKGWCGTASSYCETSISSGTLSTGSSSVHKVTTGSSANSASTTGTTEDEVEVLGHIAVITLGELSQGKSTNTIACSSGSNGLQRRFGYNNIDPMWPYVAGVSNIQWNSTKCAACYQLQSTTSTIYVSGIDRSDSASTDNLKGDLHFALPKEAFDDLLGEGGYRLGHGYAIFETVNPSNCKGNE